jgi:hypothetical protein
MPALASATFADARNRAGVALIYGFMFVVFGLALVGPLSRAQNPDADATHLLANP